MTRDEMIRIYIDAYESGSSDLRSLNGWLKTFGLKLEVKNGRVIKIIGL